jgi:hypothetical protein
MLHLGFDPDGERGAGGQEAGGEGGAGDEDTGGDEAAELEPVEERGLGHVEQRLTGGAQLVGDGDGGADRVAGGVEGGCRQTPGPTPVFMAAAAARRP